MTLIPVQVTFDGVARSEALEAYARERVEWLEQFYAAIVRCRVLIAMPHRHRHDGRHFHVRVEVVVPGGNVILVNHEPSLHGRIKDLAGDAHGKNDDLREELRYARVAVHDAFSAARRRLEDFAREQRGDVKTHA